MDSGPGGPTPGVPRVLTTSGNRTCVLDDMGEVWCWGVTPAPPIHVGGSYMQISANCGLQSSGHVECWSEPTACIAAGLVLKTDGTPLTGVTTLARTSARAFRTCAISSGQLWCWGQEGVACSSRASRVTGLPSVDSVAVSEDDTCALAGNDVWCWGPHLGAAGFPTPSFLRRDGLRVAVGGEHQLFETTVACDPPWPTSICGIGQNVDGQVQVPGPFVPTYLTSFTHTVSMLPLGGLAAGSRHSCSLDPTPGMNVVTCFGSAVALGSSLSAQVAVGTVTDLVAGEDYTCMVDTGVVLCWGSNVRNQLGTGSGPSRYTAAPIIW